MAREAVDSLIHIIESGNSWDRKNAAGALGKIKEKKSVESLIEALKREYEKAESAYGKDDL